MSSTNESPKFCINRLEDRIVPTLLCGVFSFFKCVGSNDGCDNSRHKGLSNKSCDGSEKNHGSVKTNGSNHDCGSLKGGSDKGCCTPFDNSDCGTGDDHETAEPCDSGDNGGNDNPCVPVDNGGDETPCDPVDNGSDDNNCEPEKSGGSDKSNGSHKGGSSKKGHSSKSFFAKGGSSRKGHSSKGLFGVKLMFGRKFGRC